MFAILRYCDRTASVPLIQVLGKNTINKVIQNVNPFLTGSGIPPRPPIKKQDFERFAEITIKLN
jgi:hypothetical protein